MATAKRTTNAPATESTAVAVRGPAGLAERPAWLKEGDTRGTENIGINDIKPPALKLAQATSPEVKRSEAAYIEGLREGDYFNSITKEIYGEGPLSLVVVQSLGHRHIEFAPRNEGGGVVDFNVPDGDPRTEFTTRVDPETNKEVRVKPRATKFYDYLVYVLLDGGRRELMTLSLKSTQLKKAVQLNTILAGLKMPSFAVLFEAGAVPEKKGNDNFYGWKFDLKGYVDEDTYNAASETFDQFKGKNIVVPVDETDAADDEAAEDKIPF